MIKSITNIPPDLGTAIALKDMSVITHKRIAHDNIFNFPHQPNKSSTNYSEIKVSTQHLSHKVCGTNYAALLS